MENFLNNFEIPVEMQQISEQIWICDQSLGIWISVWICRVGFGFVQISEMIQNLLTYIYSPFLK
jgi:hypothetical protein